MSLTPPHYWPCWANPGGDNVTATHNGALLCAVNLAEIVAYYAKIGAARPDIEAMLKPLPITVAPVDAALSYDACMLRPLTLSGGLSRGDRYSLALARQEGVSAMRAERRWPAIATAAGVTVSLVR